ncbi:MAG: glycine cleavage system protein GcvH [Flavobacteriales bacterium TMED96]|nr:MAG: glycine cleavage system protein GcvH [Flavobacteriales bacterium TMED96]|tara:strand:- start:3566 stop:3943 length:378 start_codon:yes stop_codon:yes gene_type:complete
MNIPENLKYTKDHEWISIEGDVATVGITDFAQGELGDIVYVEIEKIGENFSKEEVFGTVEAVKTVSDLFMPLTGEIIDINEELNEKPELVNEDPYGQGWMIKIKVNSSDISDLLNSEQYKKLVGA